MNEEIKWRNGTKVIFHLADAGAHGKLFTFSDKYPDEEQKLINELNICCEQKVKIFGFVIYDCHLSVRIPIICKIRVVA